MSFTYTGNLKLALPTTGTEAGTWGDAVNNQITSLIDQSISGTVSLTSMPNADYTLTNGNGNAANEARYMAILVPSSLTLTAARNIIVPSTSKMYLVRNSTTGGFSVTVKTSAGTGIEVPNGREMLLYCDATNVVMAFDTANLATLNGGQLAGLRNRIINGAMVIDQRNDGALVTPLTGDYLVDRWQYAGSQASKVSAVRATGANLTGFPYTLKFTSLSAYAVTTTDYFVVRQKVEGFNVADLAWGTASAKTVTISFWVNSSLTGTFGGMVLNNAANRSYGFTYTVTSAGAWEYKTVTIAGDTSGTWLTDSNTGIEIVFGLGAGTAVSKAAGSWGAGAFYSVTGAVSVVGTNAATWYISGVQLEVGSVATTFEQRPYGMELALCLRYYETQFASTYANYLTGGVTRILYGSWAAPKRATPLVSFTGATTVNTAAAIGTTSWTAGNSSGGGSGVTVEAYITGSAEL